MVDNVEKKVLVTVEILDNFIKAKGNVDFWKSALKDAQKEGGKTKKEPLFSDSFGLVAEAGFEPTTFGL